MVTQEILHKCRLAKGAKGFMAWKIDLSKAYDKLNWQFIEQVLYEIQLPPMLIKLNMSCVTTVSYQIIVNGELSNHFSAGRGIRQCDPLSPYLFVLCMEKLSHQINSAVDFGQWKPIASSQSGPSVFHLFFADDLI
ncbi:putative RNA-directed DNA polymerase [Rosa chinensis]|uniref:Putative RNA-directed DNA polymerase n=1 Tax=Rosa chinensis TaxID=74649 RepID=A0A2P6RZA3_ROSCH|nr:putative RNA-directed DNA polymerase [Rosa chinensis]